MSDRLAIFGFAALFAFAGFKLTETYRYPVDFAANVVLLVGLGHLLMYYYRKYATGRTSENSAEQRRIRLIGHVAMVAFFVLIVAPGSLAVYRVYDNLGLFGHAYLTYAVAFGAAQPLGFALLALYYLFAFVRAAPKMGAELVQAAGRLALLAFYTVAVANALRLF